MRSKSFPHDSPSGGGILRPDEVWILAQFSNYLRNIRGLRPETIRGYIRWARAFLRRAGADGTIALALLLTRANLVKVLCEMPPEQESSMRNLVFAVKALAAFAAEVGVITREAADALGIFVLKSKHKPERHHLDGAETAELLLQLLTVGAFDPTERLINLAVVATLAFTGLRNSELCNLKFADIDLDGGALQVVDGKGGKSRVVGIPSVLDPLLRLYSQHRPRSSVQNFFVGPSGRPLTRDLLVKRFARITKLTGIRVRPHDLRRGFCTRAAHMGVPIDKLQSILGHASILQTRAYIQTRNPEVASEMRSWWGDGA